jgi:hypothetical protein
MTYTASSAFLTMASKSYTDLAISQPIESVPIDLVGAQEKGIAIPVSADFIHNEIFVKLNFPEGVGVYYNPFNVLDEIVLTSDGEPDDIITSHMLDVYYDCYTPNKTVYDEFFKQPFRELDSNNKAHTCVMFPIRFFFDQIVRIKSKSTNDHPRLIKFYFNDSFMKNNADNLSNIRLSLSFCGDIYRNRNIVPYKDYALCKISREIGLTQSFKFMRPNKHDMSYDFNVANGFICKKLWFSIRNVNTNEYVTSDVVDRVIINLNMSTMTNMSIKDATVITQSRNNLTSSKNHIFVNFGEKGDNVGLCPSNNYWVTFRLNPTCTVSDLEVIGFMNLYPMIVIGG